MQTEYTRMSAKGVDELIARLRGEGFKCFQTLRLQRGRWIVRAFR